MNDDRGLSRSGISYEHPCFRPGLWVFVSESIRDVYPLNPLAGKVVQTCVGFYYPLFEMLEHKSPRNFVPCFYRNEVFYVEECFVQEIHSVS
jgi:hypothetical protein